LNVEESFVELVRAIKKYRAAEEEASEEADEDINKDIKDGEKKKKKGLFSGLFGKKKKVRQAAAASVLLVS
jgi:hypothetical protein